MILISNLEIYICLKDNMCWCKKLDSSTKIKTIKGSYYIETTK